MCNPQVLTTRYLEVLRHHLGLEAESPEELAGSVVISKHGLSYVLVNHAPYDPELLDLHLPVSREEGIDQDALAGIASDLTRRYKLVRARPVEGGIVLAVESVVAPPQVIPGHAVLYGVLPRLFAVLEDAFEALTTELQFRAIADSLREH